VLGVEGGVVWWRGLDPSPEKNNFSPQNDKFACFLTQFLTGRKHGQSLEALGHGFYGSIEKRSLENSAKIIKNSVRPGGGSHHPLPPEYATGIMYVSI